MSPSNVFSDQSKPRRHWRDLMDALWGFDFFISYAQADGKSYPALLKSELEKVQDDGQRFSVFLDAQDGFHAGDNLKLMTRRRVRSSTYLVIVGRPNALSNSRWVVLEAEHYINAQVLSKSERVPIIINIDGTLEAARAEPEKRSGLALKEDLDDWLRIAEDLKGDAERGPSAETVKDLVASYRGAGRERVRARFFAFLAGLSFILAVVAAVLAMIAQLAQREAEVNLANAYLNLADAWKREHRLNLASAYAEQALSLKDSDAARRMLLENPPASLLGVIHLADSSLSALAVSPSGMLAIGDTKGRLRIFDLGKGELAHTPIHDHALTSADGGAASHISELAFSNDGDLLALTHNGAVSLLRLTEHTPPKLVHQTDANSDPQISFLPDGRLAIVAYGSILELLDSDGGKTGIKVPVSMSGYGVSAIDSHPTELRVALLYSGGALATVDLRDGHAAKPVQIREAFPVGEGWASVSGWSVAFDPSPARDRIVVGLDDAAIWFVDAAGAILKRVPFPRVAEGTLQDPVSALRFSADGGRLLALRNDGTVGVLQRQKNWQFERIVDSFVPPVPALHTLMACCIGDGLLVSASAGRDGGDLIKVWDLSAARSRWVVRISGLYSTEDAHISALAFDREGGRLAVGISTGQIAVLDRATRSVTAISSPPGNYFGQQVTWLEFGRAANSNSIYSLARGRPLRIWSLDNCGEQPFAAFWNHQTSLYAGSLDVIDNGLAPFTDDGSQFVHLSHSAENQPTSQSAVFPGRIDHLIGLGPGAAVIGFGSGTGYFYYWEPGLQQARKYVVEEGHTMRALAATRDGNTILASGNNRLRRWRYSDAGLTELPDMPCPPEASGCSASQLVIDPQGRWFAAATNIVDGIDLRRLADGALLARLSAHTGQIDALATTPAGDLLASGGWDGQVIIWDLQALLGAPEQLRSDAQLAAGFKLEPSGLVELNPSTELLKTELAQMHTRQRREQNLRFDLSRYASDARSEPVCTD